MITTMTMMLIIVILIVLLLVLQQSSSSPIDIVQACAPTCNLNDNPVYIRLGFAAKVLEFIYNGVWWENKMNKIGAQQLLAFKLAVNYCNMLAMTNDIGDIDGDGKKGDVYLHPVVYKGEQLFNFLYYNHKTNPYFDGSYGGYFLNLISNSPLAGVITAQDDDDIVESMMNTFKGWELPTFIVKTQSTTFSHAAKYPYKARIVPADNFQTIILHEVLRSYSWKRVGIFYTDDTDGIDCYINFKRSAPDYNVEILYVAHAVATATVDYTKQINDAINNGVTIILLFMRNQQQSILLKQAFKLGLLTERTQIIGCTFSNDQTPVVGYLSSDVNDILRGYMSIKWDDKALFRTQSGKDFIQMFKTGTLNGVSLMNYTNGFQDSTFNFAKDGSIKWYSNCKQWIKGTVNGNPIYGPNIKDLNVGNQTNNYCASGTCGSYNGKPSTACTSLNPPSCPSYVPPKTCELQYLKLCEDFDANMNPLWVTNCDENSPYCGSNAYPADTIPDENGNQIPTGMCLGLTRSELDSVSNDGSSGIDPSTMYIFDAVVLNFQRAVMFTKQSYQSAGVMPTSEEANDGLAKLFDGLVSSMRNMGKKFTDTLKGLFTGDISLNVGYVDEDNFMSGDRVTSFVYLLNNWDEKSQTLQASGYYDPNKKRYTSCSDSGTLSVIGASFPCIKPRYRGGAVPSDMQPPVYIQMSPEMKSALCVFGILLLLVTIFWSVLMALNWNHKSLKLRQKYVLIFILLALFLGSFKVIITGTSSITEGYCTADYWLGHLAFRFMALPIAYKLWRVDKLFNNTTLKRIKVTESQVIHRYHYHIISLLSLIIISLSRILFFSFILIVVLILHTGLAGPKIMTRSFIKNNQVNITPFCGLGSYTLYSGAGRALNYLIFANQVFLLALALYYTFRTLNVPPMVNEAAQISPSLVFLSIASAIAYAILVAYDVDPIVRSFVIDMLFGIGGIFGSALYFGVVFYQIYKPDKKPVKSKETSDKKSDDNEAPSSSNTVKSAIIPIDENLDDLNYNVSRALLRRAKGNENKAMVCQNQIQFWRGEMLKIADQDEYSSKQSSSSSVYVIDDDNYQDSSSIYSNDDNTATATTITSDRMNP